MTRATEIRKQLAATRREMKALGIKRLSTMNRLDDQTYHWNRQLERLKLELERLTQK
jgi:hypothetical protein